MARVVKGLRSMAMWMIDGVRGGTEESWLDLWSIGWARVKGGGSREGWMVDARGVQALRRQSVVRTERVWRESMLIVGNRGLLGLRMTCGWNVDGGGSGWISLGGTWQ